MRFRPNGKMTSRRFAAVIVAAIATSTMLAALPAIAADAAPVRTSASTSVQSARTVPKLVGWTASSAAAALRSRGLAFTLIAADGSRVGTPSKWTVVKQTPSAGTQAKASTRVVLTVITTTAYVAQGVRSFYSQNYGTFATITKNGSGPTTISFPSTVKSGIVTATFSGAGAFGIAELSTGNAATGRTLVNASGPYAGSNAFGLATLKNATTAIRVTGTGAWHITVAPISSAPILGVPAAATGDTVYLYSGLSATWTVSSPGPTTFMLNQISSSSYPNLAVDESGNWAGRVAIQPGPSVVEIHSNGAWTIH